MAGKDQPHTMKRLRSGALALGLLAAPVAMLATHPSTAQAAGTTYYVHCSAGNDANAGTTQSTAWRSVARANKAPLKPGDSLLFARGCTWTGTRLNAAWNGTASAPITIGAYGSGNRPVFQDAGFANVQISGSYQFVQDLFSTFHPTNVTACGQPLGTYYGFVFNNGGNHNTLRGSQATHGTAGVHLGPQSGWNRVISNTFSANNVLQTFGANPAADLGAWGILIRSDNNEIGYNTTWANNAVCQNQGYPLMSNSVEIYEGSYNNIHHNRSFGERFFSELGSSATKKATGNLFAYNLFQTNMADSRFIVTRGAGDATYGPVWNTRVLYNTAYQTGVGSQALVCILGCSDQVLTARANVLWAEQKVLYADKPFAFSDSVVWNSAGKPYLQVPSTQTMPGITRADPMFTDRSAGNFSLRAGSPAIDRGNTQPPFNRDLAGNPVPSGAGPDQGGYERVG